MGELINPGGQTSESQVDLENANQSWFNPEQPSTVAKSEEEGLTDIRQINRTADREYAFIYDRKNSVWYYSPHEHREKIGQRRVTLRSVSKLERQPPSNDTVFCHTHPEHYIRRFLANPQYEWQRSREYLMINNQLPSKNDLESAAIIHKLGYTGFGIITTRGVTNIKFNKEKLEPGQKTLQGYRIKRERVIELAKKHGINGAIEVLTRFFYRHFKGAFEVQFVPFENQTSSEEGK
jgi:hypothetical protein